MKTILRLILLFLGIVLIALICYVAYVFLTYYRVEDNLPLEVEETGAEVQQAAAGETYRLLSSTKRT